MKASGERDDGALCRRVIEKVRASNVRVDGGVVDDGRAWLQMGKSIF